LARAKTVIILVAALAIALWVATIVTLAFSLAPPLVTTTTTSRQPTVEVTLYGGELTNGSLGFGFSPDNITSPGPTLYFKVGDVVKVTFAVVGNVPHAWEITNALTSTQPLFGAVIGSAINPILSGKNATVIFTPDRAGQFWYICPVPGHVELGMDGKVIVPP
jgi:nitrite reductase (NO-forming)